MSALFTPLQRRERIRVRTGSRSFRPAMIGRLVAAALLPVIAVAVVGAVGLQRTMSQRQDRPRPVGAPPPVAEYGSGPIKVAVVLGASGTVATDALGPYEVFAASSRFTVYTVAAGSGVAPADGAPGVLPVYTFDQIDRGQAPAPDVVVVPALADPDGPPEEPVRRFITDRANHGAHILSVCNGAEIVAATGLLDGHRATAHWSRLDALRKHRPRVEWMAGQRYVDTTVTTSDGTTAVTSTAGITSGIPGALHVLALLSGREEALRVADVVGYPGWTPEADTAIPGQRWSFEDVPTLLNNVVPWGRPTVGVELFDGVDELDVTAAFEVHTVGQVAHAVGISDTGWVTTRHGIVLAATPRAAAPWPDERVTLSLGASGPRRGFDAALKDLARAAGTRAATSTAKMVDYPAPIMSGQALRWRGARASVLLAVTTFVVGAAPLVLHHLRRRRSGSREGFLRHSCVGESQSEVP